MSNCKPNCKHHGDHVFGDAGLGDWDGGESYFEEQARKHQEKLGPRFVDKPRRTAPVGTYIPVALARAKKRIVPDV